MKISSPAGRRRHALCACQIELGEHVVAAAQSPAACLDGGINLNLMHGITFGLRQTRMDGKSASDDLPRGADVPLVETAGK
jgi:hypothetical protein